MEDDDEDDGELEMNDDDDDEENPLDMDILDAPSKSAKAKTVADVWFEQDIFKRALDADNDDEEFELERKLTSLKSTGVPLHEKPLKGILKTNIDEDDASSESDDEEKGRKSKKNKRASNDDDGFEEVPIDQRKSSRYSFSEHFFFSPVAMKRVHLDAEGLAIGHVMAQSRQNREQVIDKSYNR